MRSRAHSRRGHSLLELTIALAVLSTVLIIAAELLLARGRQMARAGKTARRMSAEMAFHQLRRDLRSARWAPGSETLFTVDPLVLEQNRGVVISWRREGTTLLRGRVDSDGDQGERPVLDGVAYFGWRHRAAASLRSLIDVEIGFEAVERPIGSGPMSGDVARQDRRRLSIALRGAGGRSW